MNEAIRRYKEKNEIWKQKKIEGCFNEVLVPQEEHGLLKRVFLLKKAKSKYIEAEKANVETILERLKEFGGIRERSFHVPKPFSIITLDEKDAKYYVMGKSYGSELGKFLDGKDKGETITALKEISKYLAFIHAKLTPDINY